MRVSRWQGVQRTCAGAFYCRNKTHGSATKKLLSTAQDFTTEQALEQGRTFEASIVHMRQLAETQGTNVNAMRTFPIRKCNNCGGSYQNDTRDQCPAYGTICNHLGKVCRLKKQRRSSKSGDRQQKTQFRPQHQSMTRRGHNGRQKGTVHSIKGQSTELCSKIYYNKSMLDTRELKSVNCAREVVSSGPAWIQTSTKWFTSVRHVKSISVRNQRRHSDHTKYQHAHGRLLDLICSVLLWWAWPLNSRGLLLKVSHCAEDSHGTTHQPDCSESHKANLLRACHTTTSCDWQRASVWQRNLSQVCEGMVLRPSHKFSALSKVKWIYRTLSKNNENNPEES